MSTAERILSFASEHPRLLFPLLLLAGAIGIIGGLVVNKLSGIFAALIQKLTKH